MSNKLISFFTTHTLVSIITATVCLGGIATFAAQTTAPEQFKPSTLIFGKKQSKSSIQITTSSVNNNSSNSSMSSSSSIISNSSSTISSSFNSSQNSSSQTIQSSSETKKIEAQKVTNPTIKISSEDALAQNLIIRNEYCDQIDLLVNENVKVGVLPQEVIICNGYEMTKMKYSNFFGKTGYAVSKFLSEKQTQTKESEQPVFAKYEDKNNINLEKLPGSETQKYNYFKDSQTNEEYAIRKYAYLDEVYAKAKSNKYKLSGSVTKLKDSVGFYWLVDEIYSLENSVDSYVKLDNEIVTFFRESAYEGGLYYDFKTSKSWIIRIYRENYQGFFIILEKGKYCESDCPKFKISGNVVYSKFFNSNEIYNVYNENYQGDVYESIENTKLNIEASK